MPRSSSEQALGSPAGAGGGGGTSKGWAFEMRSESRIVPREAREGMCHWGCGLTFGKHPASGRSTCEARRLGPLGSRWHRGREERRLGDGLFRHLLRRLNSTLSPLHWVWIKKREKTLILLGDKKIPLPLSVKEKKNLGRQTPATIFSAELEAGSWNSFSSVGYGPWSHTGSPATLLLLLGSWESEILLPPGVHSIKLPSSWLQRPARWKRS